MVTIECCLGCAFMAWDRRRERFICIRIPPYHIVSPSAAACNHAKRKTYRRRKERSLPYQMELFTERR